MWLLALARPPGLSNNGNMAIQDTATRLHDIVRERTAESGVAQAGCCGGTGEHPAVDPPAGAPDSAVCPDTREPCPTPLTAAEVLATFRAEAETWSLDHNGDTIHGRTFGEGPPLYLLNGVLGTHELHVLLAWVLREHFRCILFDWPPERIARRGAGPAIAPFVEDLMRVADFHGDEQFPVFGTSFGGQIALAAMQSRPERIARAVLHGAFASRRLSVFERLLVRSGRWSPGTVRRLPLFEAILRQNHRPWFPPFDAARFRFLVDETGQTSIRTAARRVDALRRTDLRPGLGEIRQPVLLVRTEGEGAVSSAAHDLLTASLPNATSEWLHTCGQLPHLTHPHRMAKLLRSFLLEAAPIS